jgi:hypothetical protein
LLAVSPKVTELKWCDQQSLLLVHPIAALLSYSAWNSGERKLFLIGWYLHNGVRAHVSSQIDNTLSEFCNMHLHFNLATFTVKDSASIYCMMLKLLCQTHRKITSLLAHSCRTGTIIQTIFPCAVQYTLGTYTCLYPLPLYTA